MSFILKCRTSMSKIKQKKEEEFKWGCAHCHEMPYCSLCVCGLFWFFFWRLLKPNSSSLFALWMLTESSFLISGKTVLKERRLKAVSAIHNFSEVLYRLSVDASLLTWCSALLPHHIPIPLFLSPLVKSNAWKTLSRGAVLANTLQL